jgi:hypothetical protein
MNQRTLFDENYALASTQALKNKDIPEDGAKGTILPSYAMTDSGQHFLTHLTVLALIRDCASRNTSMFVQMTHCDLVLILTSDVIGRHRPHSSGKHSGNKRAAG